MIDARPFFQDERPRQLALALRRELGLAAFELEDTAASLEAATKRADLHVHAFGRASTFREGVLGALQRGYGLLRVSAALAEPTRNWVIAHEIGHFHLHEEDGILLRNACIRGVREQRLEGYSPDERREFEADIFAAEFLCPRAGLRGAMSASEASVSEISTRLRVPMQVVLAQAIGAWYGPDANQSQRAASDRIPAPMRQADVSWRPGACSSVQGAPGCGKTALAISEVDALIGRGTPAGKVAFCARTHALAARALTMMKPEARGVWHGTLASLATEILRAHPRAGRSGGFSLLDDVGAVRLLEAHKAKLPPPFVDLPDSTLRSQLLRAYRSIAQAERAGAAPNPLWPLSDLNQTYCALLIAADAFDAAFLPRACAEMLERNDDVARHVAGRWTHLVVDDFEEAGRHEAAIVQLLVKAGIAVLCLSSPRHAIYSFRGVDPTPSSRVLAPPMKRTTQSEGQADAIVMSRRPSSGRDGDVAIGISHPRDIDAEAHGIAARAAAWVGLGIALDRQVVLARRHDTLAGLARRLRGLGLAVSHPLDALQQEGVLDLLAVIGVVQDPEGRHLEHLCGPRLYDICAQDRIRLVREVKSRGCTSMELLRQVADGRLPTFLTEGGMDKLHAMAKDFGRIPVGADPWECATTWLFETGGSSGQRHATSSTATDGREAIHAFLGVCEEQHRFGDPSIENLIARVKRLRSLSQNTNYATASESMRPGSLRLATIHAAKGRSFEGVHLVGLSTWRERITRDAAGAATEVTTLGDKALFETAVSRATGRLHLSRIKMGSPPPRFILDFERNVRAGAQLELKTKAGNRTGPHRQAGARAPAISARENYSPQPFG